MDQCTVASTCDMDGYFNSGTGVTEHYWHCEELAVGILVDGLKLCQKHLDLWNEDFTA
jgi:hypothetical protein